MCSLNADQRLQCISEVNLHAMRMGPGKHLKGRKLMGGLVKPEEVCFVTFSFIDID